MIAMAEHGIAEASCGVNPCLKETFKTCMAEDGEGEYVCTVRACDLKLMSFAHGIDNVCTIGSVQRSRLDFFSAAAAMAQPIPVACLSSAISPKAGALAREGSDAYHLSFLLAWSDALRRGDVEQAKAFEKHALAMPVRFVRAVDNVDAMALKW